MSVKCLGVAVALEIILCLAARSAPVARVVRDHGGPAIIVDGKVLPPMAMTLREGDCDNPSAGPYLQRLGAAGVRLFFVCCHTSWQQPGDSVRGIPRGGDETLSRIRTILKAVPDAYVILRLTIAPSAQWVNAHPEEQVVYSDGKPRRTLCTSVSRTETLNGMHSMCSEAWRREGAEGIADFIAELKAHPEFDRVIGFFPCAGGTSEWYYPATEAGGRLCLADGCTGDCSDSFRREFVAYLRGRYGDVATLRKVWKRPEATFEHPPIPSASERAYVTATDMGVFVDANVNRPVVDYYHALHQATAKTLVRFARVFKRLCPDRLVGAFYGCYGCQDYFDSGTATAVFTVLDGGAIDFLSAPGTYNGREPGGLQTLREMHDSLRLRDLVFVNEYDTRTHRDTEWQSRAGQGLDTVRDSIDCMKRDFAQALCEDIHGWWFDMAFGPEKNEPYWYDDPEILGLIAQEQAIAAEAYSLDRTKRSEIAVVHDTESLHYVSQKLSEVVLDYYRTTDLSRIGAPADYYFHNDLSDPRMPDYKLYVMLNQYCLTDTERAAVYAKARKNGATVLWMYAAGYEDPDAEREMSVENVSRTVGMMVCLIDRNFSPKFKIDPKAHPAVALASPTHRYGTLDRELYDNWNERNRRVYPYLNPGFYVDDASATALGHYCCDGRVALALKRIDGVTSVYCATPVVRSDVLASVAQYAGCHLYAQSEDVLFANENYVAVHAKDDGRRTIRLKRKCSPYEVFERKSYGANVDSIDVEMRLGETHLWRVAESSPDYRQADGSTSFENNRKD